MNAETQKEHQWLQTLVGEWTYVSECSMAPGKAPEKFSGAENVRSLGDLWILCESTGQMPGGGTATMVMTLGYDPGKKRYVGTWVGSMMTFSERLMDNPIPPQRISSPDVITVGVVIGELFNFVPFVEAMSSSHHCP